MFLLNSVPLVKAVDIETGRKGRGENLLEFVGLTLPRPVTLDPDANAAKDHFLSAPEINAQLDNIPIFDRVELGRHVGLAESHVVQEGPRRTAHVLDVPLAVHENQLTVLAADDFGFEADRGIRRVGRVGDRDAITFGIPSHPNHAAVGRQRPRERNEMQRRPGTLERILVGEEADRGLLSGLGEIVGGLLSVGVFDGTILQTLRSSWRRRGVGTRPILVTTMGIKIKIIIAGVVGCDVLRVGCSRVPRVCEASQARHGPLRLTSVGLVCGG